MVGLVLRGMVRAIPVGLAIFYGMAWWTVKRGKVSGRLWAIAASVAMLLLLVPFLVVTYFALTYAPRGAGMGFLIIDGVVLAIGIPGLLAFAPRNSMAQGAAEAASKPPRIAGDEPAVFLTQWSGCSASADTLRQ